MKTFRPYEPDQMLLLPPSLSDWVPEDHLARFVSDLVDTLDLSAIEDTYTEERGFPPYHPCMMVKVLLYAYCTGTYASRRIARQLQDSVALRYLAAGNQPDFRTISDFRKHHLPALAGLFEQVLTICREAGMVKLGRVAVDGTKMKANASKHKAMSYGRMREKDKALKREIRELLDRAEAADRDDDRRYGSGGGGEDLPAELARRDSRLKKIREARATLEARVRERAGTPNRSPRTSTTSPIRSRGSRKRAADTSRATTHNCRRTQSGRWSWRSTSRRTLRMRGSCSRQSTRSRKHCGPSRKRSWPTRATGRKKT
jgi:transposase